MVQTLVLIVAVNFAFPSFSVLILVRSLTAILGYFLQVHMMSQHGRANPCYCCSSMF
ncbi:hypothetical protein OIU74_028007 [Salix koriyanagi]|uniref:Uncharacterized protein n=1 Tax=Salix koriyanagi TaxID=2511006 RepID=A0A9Q0VBD7_9ROSI|nr:hypothetical protein OIU74_028007 [Salix koriyanagi]